MREIVFDIEADGLQPTEIFCVCTEEVGTGEKRDFTDRESFAQFVEENKDARFIAHNGICYDYPVLSDLWSVAILPEQQYDTMVLSRLASPSRAGGHGLKHLSALAGCPKLDAPAFDRFTPELLDYCRGDVSSTVAVLRMVTGELEHFDQRAIDLEHEVARIIFSQEENGWLLDTERVFDLLAVLKERKMELEDKVHETFRPIAVPIKEVVPKIKNDGTFSRVGLQWLGERALELVGGPCTRIDFPEFNLGSRQQIGVYLQRFGWKPTKFTDNGQPIVAEKVLMAIKGIPEAELIADFLTVQKRIAMAQSWLDFQQDDGRVHGRVNSNGAVTGRMTHYEPNMAQVTAGSKIYGTEMRQCWVCPEGRVIVGCDASGLELRMLAHYMADEEYIREVVDGDVHTANQRAAGFGDRDQAKTFIYAFMYGAGDEKIGAIAGKGKAAGARLKSQFLERTPALKRLKERVERASGRGYLHGLDGRRISVRSRHASLNSLLQGAGAVIMKQALVNLVRMANAHKLDYKLVGSIHDEFQSEVLEAHADKFGKLAVYSIVKAGQDFNLRCPLAAKYKVGASWAETH